MTQLALAIRYLAPVVMTANALVALFTTEVVVVRPFQIHKIGTSVEGRLGKWEKNLGGMMRRGQDSMVAFIGVCS